MNKRPNILFIFSDQQRWDTCGCYGGPAITPHLDACAREGILFNNSFTCQPVCGPARACLQTGKYATETGCFRNALALPQNEKTLAHYLNDAGYDTAYIGKWHLASTQNIDSPPHEPDISFEKKAVPPERRGGYTDYWLASDTLEHTSHSYDGYMFDANMQRVDFPDGRYRVDALTDYAIEYLTAHPKDKPFFLFLSFLEPHHQNDHNTFEGPKGSRERFADYPVPDDLRACDEGDWKNEYPDYLGCVASIDENVGRLRALLEKTGLAENTLVVYTSDHACHFRTRNSEYKRSCHDNSIRTPCIITGPGFRGGRDYDELVSLIDIPPTVLRAVNVPVPQHMQGTPLQELIHGHTQNWQDDVFIQISESEVGRAVRTMQWKYGVTAPNLSGVNDPCADIYMETYLYDIVQDPCEQNNLVRDPAYEAVRAVLSERLIKRMNQAGESLPRIIPCE